MTETAEPLRIPIAHSVRYAARGLPEVPNQYGGGILVPSEITLTYRAAPDSGLGRVHAYVAGRLWADGAEIPLLPGGLYGQHYDDGLDGWPEWLAEEARLHDPDAAVPSAPADRAAVLTADERAMLSFALDLAQDRIFYSGPEFTADDQAAVDSLRRMADEAQQPEPVSPAYARLQAAAKEASEAAHLHAMRGMKRAFQLARRYGTEPIPAAEVLEALGLDENANTVEPAKEA